ncbi:MAG: Arc family DNA-binding protein [Oscillospiraceae bacterium]|nr:Arc family DNA-binding protein [Ruminococcus sp.]MDE6706579.1 Arc family DNA-binding protein [Oscillospiraceae bacterium]
MNPEEPFQIEKGYDKISKTFRLPVNLSEELERLANENNISVNSLVIQCLLYALGKLST